MESHTQFLGYFRRVGGNQHCTFCSNFGYALSEATQAQYNFGKIFNLIRKQAVPFVKDILG